MTVDKSGNLLDLISQRAKPWERIVLCIDGNRSTRVRVLVPSSILTDEMEAMFSMTKPTIDEALEALVGYLTSRS